jgi:hypothetical protein
VNATVLYKPFKLSVLDSVINEVLNKLHYVRDRRSLAAP